MKFISHSIVKSPRRERDDKQISNTGYRDFRIQTTPSLEKAAITIKQTQKLGLQMIAYCKDEKA